MDHLNGIIRGCIWDPNLGAGNQHPNARFFSDVEWYLTCRQITHAGDIFNTYCQNILAEILEADATQWEKTKEKLSHKNREAAIKSLRSQRESDRGVREVLRDSLGVAWCNEIEIICKLRNKVVHQAGLDSKGEVIATAKKFPPGEYRLRPTDLDPQEFPVACTPEGKLQIDARSAHWATRWVEHHIHLMDQNICHRFELERKRRPAPSHSFQMREGAHPQLLLPGTPLPKAPAPPAPIPAPPLPELPNLEPVVSPEEATCAKIWHELQQNLDAFVREICEAYEIQIKDQERRPAGQLLPHTLSNHDIHLGYKLSPADSISERHNHLGIRIRQINFEPFVTIWSTKTVMRDFTDATRLEEMKDELVTAIHATTQ